jgi:hypothetical protein
MEKRRYRPSDDREYMWGGMELDAGFGLSLRWILISGVFICNVYCLVLFLYTVTITSCFD